MHILKKIFKVLSYIIIGIVLLLLIVSIFIDPIAKNYLENQINEADQGQYSAQIDNVNVSILRGNFIINGISLETDTLTARENETPVIDLEAGEISVEGVSWLNFLLTNNLQLDRISFLDLNIEAKVRTTAEADTTGPFKWDDLDIYPMIKDQVDRIRLDDLRFSNIDLTLINIESDDTLKFSAEEFNLFSDDILIDADRVFTDSRAFYTSQIDIHGKDVKVSRVGNPQWDIEMGLIEVDTRESDLGILTQNLSFFKKGFSDKDTVMFLSIHDFALNDLNMNRVQEDSVAKIRNVALNHLTFINNMEIDEENVAEVDKKTPGFDVTEFSLGDNLPDLLDRLIIGEIALQDINYKELEHLSVRNVNLSANEIIIDNQPAFAEKRFLHAEQFDFSIENVNYLEKEQMLLVTLKDLGISIENGTGNINIDHLTAKNTERSPGEMYTEAALGGFTMAGINTRDLINKRFSIDSIAIEYPDLLVDLGGATNDLEENGNGAPLDLYPAIADILQEVQINKIAVIEGNIRVSGMEGNENTVHLPAVYVQLSDLLIAEGTAFAGRRILHADDIAVRLERINFPLPDNVYMARLNLFNMSTREKFIQAHGLSYNYNQNFKKILEEPESNQVFSIKNNFFKISNLDYESLIKEKGFFAGSVISDGLQIEVFKDNHYPEEETEEDLQPTPQQLIKDIDLPMYLGELSVNNANFIFEELAEGGEKSGIFTISDLNFNVNKLTNVDQLIGNNLETVFNVNGFLMGDGFFETEMIIPMHDVRQPVKIAGRVDTLDLTKLNRYTEYTTRFGMESGTIFKIIWDFEAGKEQSVGKFGLSYEDLSVQLSEGESPAQAGTLWQIGAYLANVLVLDSDIAEGKTDPAEIAEFERDKEEEESFIEHYIASLMAGFVEVMGFPLSIIDP
ncbi:hypothetical protein BH23BAC1_BH23BAC1_27570 [soil metagenome]